MPYLFTDPTTAATLGFSSLIPGNWEWLIILLIGLLLFGRRLPEVGRNIGKTVVEFRRGISDIEKEVDEESKRDRSLPKGESSSSTGVQPDERAVAQEAREGVKASEA